MEKDIDQTDLHRGILGFRCGIKYIDLPDNSGGLEPLPIKLEFIIYPSRL